MVYVADAIGESSIPVFTANAVIVIVVPSPATLIAVLYTGEDVVGSVPSVV
jgi:hypothetical protein